MTTERDDEVLADDDALDEVRADDDALMGQLREAMLAGDAVSDRARQAARAAFSWRTIDEELLTLAHDSLAEAGAGAGAGSLVRGPSAAQAARVLSYAGPGLRVELELDAGDLMGQVLPGHACRVTVQTPSAPERTVEADASGVFNVPTLGAGPVRFVIEDADGRRTTQWLMP